MSQPRQIRGKSYGAQAPADEPRLKAHLAIRVEPELLARLKERARTQGKTVSAVVVAALERAL